MKPNKRELGTCYYPEHWPEDLWQTDAEQMINLGLKWVRIGEFSWSRLEPKENEFSFEWLVAAVQVVLMCPVSSLLLLSIAPRSFVCSGARARSRSGGSAEDRGRGGPTTAAGAGRAPW